MMKTIPIDISVKAVGEVEVSVDGELTSRHNDMLAGMGKVFAAALKGGSSKKINGIYALQDGGSGRLALSAPTRTGGGRGSNDWVEVQANWTNTTGSTVVFKQLWLTSEPFDANAQYLDIANVDNDSISVSNNGTLTVKWKVSIPSSACQLSQAQRNQLAKGINPESAYGGTIYNINKGKFIYSSGDSGMISAYEYTGGDGLTQRVTVDVRKTLTASHTITEAEFYNSNNELVIERTGLSLNGASGNTIRMLLTVTGLGVSSGGGGGGGGGIT